MIGIDEVGRGAWAGPLLVVAARLKQDVSLPDGLTDSKLLSKAQKDSYYEQLLYTCEFGEGWVDVEEIDSLGLGGALRLGAARAVGQLRDTEGEEIIIDGSVDLLGDDFPLSHAMKMLPEPLIT
jgi:ribonuclease HII